MSRILPALGLMLFAGMAGCADSPTGPDAPVRPGGFAGSCSALDYAGATGGERIQRAIDDQACATVFVSPDGPDAGGVWLVAQSIRLRSNVTLTGTPGIPATLRAAGSAPIRMMVIDRQSRVAIRELTLDGAKLNPTGILIVGSSDVDIERMTVSAMAVLGVMIRDVPSAAITISASRFEDNGFIDVRTETSGGDAHHSGVVVVSNAMFGTTYAVALANCGRDDATRCSVLRNVMRPKAVYPGTGVDLNRSHAALVSGNDIVGAGDMCSTSPDRCDCGRGITVDDTQRSTIVGNRVEGCSEEGILLANGAVAAHRPWLVSANTVINNTVRNNGFVGLAAYHDPRNPDDRNLGNVFSNNHVAGNGRGGCGSNAPDQTFVDNGPQPCVPGAGFTAGGRLPPAITSRSASGRSP